MADKTDFSSATEIPFSQTPAPLANQNFGPKVDWPSATHTVQPPAKREGPGAWQDTGKGSKDFTSATETPAPAPSSVNTHNRPTANPPGWEKK